MCEKINKYVCDKYYHIETKNYGMFVGYMLNYYNGNIVMLSTKGIIHMPYSEAYVIKPLKESSDEKLKKMVEDINSK